MSNIIKLKDYEKIVYNDLEDEEKFLKFLEENQDKILELDFSHVEHNSSNNSSNLQQEDVIGYLEEISHIITENNENLFEKSIHSVTSQSFHYLRESFSYLDIVQEANIGLLNGIEAFGDGDIALFDNYKNFWVIRAIVLYLKNELENTKNSFLRYFKMEEEHLAHHHFHEENEPTMEEIHEFLNEEENSAHSLESLKEKKERILKNFDFFKTKNILSPEEIQVLNLYFGFGVDKRHSIYEIEKKLEIEKDQGDTIFQKAIEKISIIKEKSYI